MYLCRIKYVIVVILLLSVLFSYAQICKTVNITSDITIPWDMEWLNDDVIIFTELGGKIKQLNVKTKEVKELYEITKIAREAQSGLMGIAVNSDFKKNPYVYIVYTVYDTSFNLKTRISRLDYSIKNQKLTNETILFDHITCSSTNIGGRILHSNNYLYITVGDAAYDPNAQDISSLNGKILRINDDGSIPIDNPIKNSEIWTLGHRNPQGITSTPHGIYISEHGSFIDDEINKIGKGFNYGWPEVTGDDSSNGYKSSEFKWTNTIAPSGIDYCESCLNTDSSALLVAVLKEKQLKALWFNKDQKIIRETTLVDKTLGRIRDVLVSKTGEIYICTSNKDIYGQHSKLNDGIFKLEF
jgi:glucose/arabinose dehydrogenase